MTAQQTDATTDPRSIIAALQQRLDAALLEKAVLAEELAARTAELATRTAQLAQRNTDYSDRIKHQAATIDVLKAMSASPDDPQPAFNSIVRHARDLCGGYGATVSGFDGTLIHWRAATGVSDDPLGLVRE